MELLVPDGPMTCAADVWIETEDNRWVRASAIVALEIRQDSNDNEFPFELYGIYGRGIPLTDDKGRQTIETECLLEFCESRKGALTVVREFVRMSAGASSTRPAMLAEDGLTY